MWASGWLFRNGKVNVRRASLSSFLSVAGVTQRTAEIRRNARLQVLVLSSQEFFSPLWFCHQRPALFSRNKAELAVSPASPSSPLWPVTAAAAELQRNTFDETDK